MGTICRSSYLSSDQQRSVATGDQLGVKNINAKADILRIIIRGNQTSKVASYNINIFNLIIII